MYNTVIVPVKAHKRTVKIQFRKDRFLRLSLPDSVFVIKMGQSQLKSKHVFFYCKHFFATHENGFENLKTEILNFYPSMLGNVNRTDGSICFGWDIRFPSCETKNELAKHVIAAYWQSVFTGEMLNEEAQKRRRTFYESWVKLSKKDGNIYSFLNENIYVFGERKMLSSKSFCRKAEIIKI